MNRSNLLPLALQCRRAWPKLAVIILLLWGALPVGAAYLANDWDRSRVVVSEESVQDRAREIPRDGDVQSKAFRSCHPQEYASWRHSFHRTMTQIATPESVIGDFDDIQLELGDRNCHAALVNQPLMGAS